MRSRSLAVVLVLTGCAQGADVEDVGQGGAAGAAGGAAAGGRAAGGAAGQAGAAGSAAVGGGAGSSGGQAGTSGGTGGGGTGGGTGGSAAATGGTGGSGAATGGTGGTGGAATGGTGGAGTGGSGGVVGPGPTALTCAPGEFVVGVEASGAPRCVSAAPLFRAAINQSCRVYLGWRDSCDGCTNPPSRWGYASASGCVSGAGTTGVCRDFPLGGATVHAYGVNTGGDVDGDDKFYLGFQCFSETPLTALGACPAGEFVTAVGEGGAVTCAGLDALARQTANQDCQLYAGWRDSCSGCTTAPVKAGRVSGAACEHLLGSADTCTQATLGGVTQPLWGIDTDGNVNDDDQFYVAFACQGDATPDTGAAATCPAGELAVGFTGRTPVCAPAAPAVLAAVDAGCTATLGWQDSCGACLDAPAKWGRVGRGRCAVGAGGDCTCGSYTLGVDSVDLLGINTDGDVDDNDLFHFGFQCF